MLATTFFTGFFAVAMFSSPEAALAACAGENTAVVLCDAANPATAGTLATTFATTTTVTDNNGGAINVGGATATVTTGTLTFHNNDSIFGISSAATGVTLNKTTGAINYDGSGSVSGTTGGISASTSGSVSIGPSGTVSTTAGTGIDISSGGGSVSINPTNSVGSTAGTAINVSSGGGGVSGTIAGAITAGTTGVNISSGGGGVVLSTTAGGSINAGGTGLNIATGGGDYSGTIGGVITATGTGIAVNTGGGSITSLTTNAAVSGDNPGIDLNGAGGNVNYTANANVTGAGAGGDGVHAVTTGTGTITVTVNAGTINGTTGFGINTSAVDGATVVNLTGGVVTGTLGGVNMVVTGGGASTLNMSGSSSIGTSGSHVGGIGVQMSQPTNLSTTSLNIITGSIYSTGNAIDAQITGLATTGSINIATLPGNGVLDATAGSGINARITQPNSTGDINIGTSTAAPGINGNITAGGGNNGVNAINSGIGNVNVFSAAGTTIRADGAIGIDATAARGTVTVNSKSVIGALGNEVATGINGQVLNSAGAGQVNVTQNGSIFGTTTGINASNAGAGGIVVNLTGGTITMTGGTGIAALVTGSSGGITVTVGGGGIDPPNYGNTSVINNAGNSSDVTVHANAPITGILTGVVANTDGTGSVRVDGSAAVVGGSGAPVIATAQNFGIFAAQTGATGSVTVNGAGSTSGTIAIGAYVGGTGNFNTADLSNTAGAGGGNVTVTRSGTITSTGAGGAGIDARVLAGGGFVEVTGVGSITTNAGGTGVTGINAVTSESGNVTVNGTGAIVAAGGGTILTGVNAQSLGSGEVKVLNTGAVTATLAGGFGINASSNGGNLTVTPGSTVAGDIGINAQTNNTGTIVINTTAGTVSGNVGAASQGIVASTTSGTINITTAAVNGNANGVNANSTAGGAVTVTTQGNVNGDADATGTGTGIIAHQAGGNGAVSVNSLGTVSGANGIDAQAVGNGDVTVHTGTGAAGNVTGTAGFGISAVGVSGSKVLVTADDVGSNNSQIVSGTTFGVTASSSGTAPVGVTGNASINTTGATATAAISAVETGTGPGVGLNAVRVTGTGNTDASASGTGIIATIANAGNASNILVDRSGTIKGGINGIDAEITAGTGNVTVTGVGNVTAGTGTGIIAIQGGATNTTGSVIVTPPGTVSGSNGIDAEVAFGAGTVTVTTANGAAGNVTGTAGFGVKTAAVDGNTVVTNNAATVSGTTSADTSTSSGLGTLTVTGAGTFAGGTVSGITATLTGANPSVADGIIISGTGNTSATTGVGIDAQITNAGNSTNINITRSGTVTVAAGGGNGVNAVTAGLGSVTVNGVGNVAGGAAAIGINAQNTNAGAANAVTVTPAGTVSAGTGIQATNAGTAASSTVTVTTAAGAAGNVTGGAGAGILTSAVNGNTVVTNNAATVSGTTSGDTSASTGTGTITVTGAGTYAGGTVSGITATLSGANASVADGIIISGTGNTSATTGVGIDAQITNAANNTNINITRSGTVTVAAGGGNGVNAVTAGLGSVSVTGVGNVTAGTAAGVVGINAQNTNAGASNAVTVTPGGTVSGGTGINATNAGTAAGSTVTVTTGFNVTGTAGNGITTSAVTGLNTVNVTAGIIQATANGIDSTSTGTGGVVVNMTGGQVGTSTALRVGGIGINASSSGASGDVTVTSQPIFAVGDGIDANITNAASTARIAVTVNGNIDVSGVPSNGVTAGHAGLGVVNTDMINVTNNADILARGSIADGIAARASNAGALGNITVTNNANHIVDAQFGFSSIRATMDGLGALTVTNDGRLFGWNNGVNGAITNAANSKLLMVTNTGTIDVLSSGIPGGTNGAGINVATSGTGGITVNDTGVIGNTGSVDGYGTTQNARSTGGGIFASSSGTAGDVTITSGLITSTTDGVNATITGASTGNIVVTQNGAIDVSAGDGIDTSITNAASTGNITVNVNANINAPGTGMEGVRSNNAGSGSSSVTIASGLTVTGDPGVINDTAGGNALVTVNNNDVVQGAAGVINRQNGAAGPGYATVTVGANSTITGDNSATTATEPLTGYGIYNLNKATVSTGAGTQNSPDSAFVVFGGAGNIVNARGDVQNVGVSGIFNQAYGSSAMVDTGGNALTVNVTSGAVGGSFGINNSTASTTAGDVDTVNFTGASTISLATGGSNSNAGILASNILSPSNGNAPPATVGDRPIVVTTGTSSVINVTAAGTAATAAAAGAGNIGIAAVSGATASAITVTTGTSSAINVGAGSTAALNSSGVYATSAGSGLITLSAGDTSTITVGLGDASRGVWGRATGTGGVTITTGNGSNITLSDSTPGGVPTNGSNAVRADSTSGDINVTIGRTALGGGSVLNVGGTAGGAVVRAETTAGGNIFVTTQTGTTLDSAGSEGRGIVTRLSTVGTGSITVTNNAVIGTGTATRVGLTGIVADQNPATPAVQTGNISVTNTVNGKIFAGTDGILAGGSTIVAAGSNADITVSNAGLVDANQRGVAMGSPGLGTAGDAAVVSLTNTGTIIGGRTAGAATTAFTAIDVGNGNTAVVGGTAVQTTINNTGNGTTTGIIQGAGQGDAIVCPIDGPAGAGCNPTVYVHTASGANLNNNGGLITDLNNNAASRGTLALYFTSPGTATNTIANTGTITGRAQFSSGTDVFNNNAGGVWNMTDGAAGLAGGQAAANFGDITKNNTLANAGTINTFGTTSIINLPTLTNSGIFNAGDTAASITSISTNATTVGPAAATGISQTVTNTGTFNVKGQLRFISDATFNNAGGIIDMRTVPTVTTDYTTLNTNIGTGALSNTYTPGAAYDFAGGAGSRLGVDTFIGGVASTGSNVPSDRLVISGTATSTTSILVNDTNPASGAFNPLGITLVGVNGASSNAFFLGGLTSTAPFDVLQTNRGPMGAIKKGFWFYPLLQSTHAEALADGLTGASSSEYKLYGLPDVEAYQLTVAMTGLQNIWFTTAADWDDRQDDLHRWIRRGQMKMASAAGGGADVLPVKQSAPGYAASTGPGVWLKASGSWTNRDTSRSLADLVPAAIVLPPFDISYNQNTFSLVGGVDVGREALFAPADQGVLGLMGGYIESKLSFKNSGNSFTYTGGTVGVSGTYMYGGFFADALFKADFLRVNLDMPSLAPFAFTGQSVDARTYGALGNLGYRYDVGAWYIEPRLTLAYARSTMDSFTGLGTGVSFNTGESFRGAAGARVGGIVYQTATHVLDASITGRVWDEFSNSNGVLFTTTGPGLTLGDTHAKVFGDVTGMLDYANRGLGWSGFLNGGLQFNNEFKTTSVKGGARYQW